MSEQQREKLRSATTLHQVVAEKVGFTPAYVKMVERGVRNNLVISNEIEKLRNLVSDFKKDAIG